MFSKIIEAHYPDYMVECSNGYKAAKKEHPKAKRFYLAKHKSDGIGWELDSKAEIVNDDYWNAYDQLF